MKELAIVCYEFICVALPALVVYGASGAVRQKNGIQQRRGYLFGLLLLTIYLTGVFQVTGAGTIFHLRQYGLEPSVLQMNLLPFSDPAYDPVANLLNVVLFLPLGFLLPLLWPEWNRPIRVLLFGLSFTVLIEVSQLLNIRNTDIDDVLLNTLGAIIGFLLFWLYARLSKRAEQPATGRRWEAILYIAAMFAGYFLLFNEFGAAKLLYGF